MLIFTCCLACNFFARRCTLFFPYWTRFDSIIAGYSFLQFEWISLVWIKNIMQIFYGCIFGLLHLCVFFSMHWMNETQSLPAINSGWVLCVWHENMTYLRNTDSKDWHQFWPQSWALFIQVLQFLSFYRNENSPYFRAKANSQQKDQAKAIPAMQQKQPKGGVHPKPGIR